MDDDRNQTSETFGRILCPINFSDASSAALEQALRFVQWKEGRLTFLHVLQGTSPNSATRFASHFVVPEYRHLVAHKAWERLQNVIPAAVRKSNRVHARLAMGRPADEIIRVAKDVNADLIVIGVTSRGAIGRQFIASTAARIVRRAQCPVLVVPEHSQRRARLLSDVASMRTAA